VTKVLIADDHRIVCEALTQALEREPGVQVVGVAADGREAVRMTKKLKPDIVILDITMPGLSGIEAAAQIRAQEPQTRLIALSMHSDRRYVTGALAAGVSGYLVKDCALEELALALKTVEKGQVYLSPRIAGVVVESLQQAAPAAAASADSGGRLTGRVREVLQLIAEGHSVREIAALLNVSAKTVETHRSQLMKKLGIANVAGLTKYAIREGLTSLDS
jgi:DNA-binding NarL/FixJ family response regulator